MLRILVLFAWGWRGSWWLRWGSHLKWFRLETVSWLCFAWQESKLISAFKMSGRGRNFGYFTLVWHSCSASRFSFPSASAFVHSAIRTWYFQIRSMAASDSDVLKFHDQTPGRFRGLHLSRNSRPGRPSKPVQLVWYCGATPQIAIDYWGIWWIIWAK